MVEIWNLQFSWNTNRDSLFRCPPPFSHPVMCISQHPAAPCCSQQLVQPSPQAPRKWPLSHVSWGPGHLIRQEGAALTMSFLDPTLESRPNLETALRTSVWVKTWPQLHILDAVK